MADEMNLIRHALQIARSRGFSEVSIKTGDTEFSAILGSSCVGEARATAVVEPAALIDSGLVPIASPVVGYYRESDDPLLVGRRVEKGAVVAVVAALGLANEVEAPISGEVVEVLVESNQAVEFGQPLALVKGS